MPSVSYFTHTLQAELEMSGSAETPAAGQWNWNNSARVRMANSCPGPICERSCLPARIVESISSSFFMPHFLEPCMMQEMLAEEQAEQHYWLWINRTVLDRIIVN